MTRVNWLGVLTPAVVSALQEAAASGAEEVVILTAPKQEDFKFESEVAFIRSENAERKAVERDARRKLLEDAKRRSQSIRSRGRR